MTRVRFNPRYDVVQGNPPEAPVDQQHALLDPVVPPDHVQGPNHWVFPAQNENRFVPYQPLQEDAVAHELVHAHNGFG